MSITKYLEENLNTNLLTDFSLIQKQFDKTAKFMLRNCLIEVDDLKYRITEIEFYYYREDGHKDPFVHKHINQKEMGVWYFHNVGQDITFGDKTNYGGILIRGILPKGSDPCKGIDGPVRSYDRLFNPMLELDKKHFFGITISKEPLISQSAKVYKFPRAGMYPKGKKNPGEYIFLPYRYMLYPECSKVERHVLYLYLNYFEVDKKRTSRLLVDNSMKESYDNAFNTGLKMNKDEMNRIFSGELNMNVENKCKLLGYYKEHGKL